MENDGATRVLDQAREVAVQKVVCPICFEALSDLPNQAWLSAAKNHHFVGLLSVWKGRSSLVSSEDAGVLMRCEGLCSWIQELGGSESTSAGWRSYLSRPPSGDGTLPPRLRHLAF